MGVTAGDRVALVLPNCPQHVVAFYAVLRLGAIVVEHNPLYTPPELRHQFEDHGARVAIVWNSIADTVAEFPSDIRPAHIVAVDLTKALPFGKRMALRLPIPKARRSRAALTTTPRARGLVHWERLISRRALATRHPRPLLDDTAVLQYTSGTTGSRRAPCSATATCVPTRCRGARGCRASPRARRSSTGYCRSSTPTV